MGWGPLHQTALVAGGWRSGIQPLLHLALLHLGAGGLNPVGIMTTPHNPTLDIILELLTEIGQPLDAKFNPATASLREIGLDSLSVLELLMLIDERTGVEISTEQVENGTTLLSLTALIDQQAAG